MAFKSKRYIFYFLSVILIALNSCFSKIYSNNVKPGEFEKKDHSRIGNAEQVRREQDLQHLSVGRTAQEFLNPFSWQERFFGRYFGKPEGPSYLIDLDCFVGLGRECGLKEGKVLEVLKKETKIQGEDSSETSFFPWLKRLYISYLGGGPGWMNLDAYGSLGMLFASEPKEHMLMVDFRGHVFNQRLFASTLGIVGRNVSLGSNDTNILGFNFYWDFREAYWINFNQFGVGFEVLKSRWDLRGTLSYPLGAKVKKHRSNFFYPGGFFWIQQDVERPCSPSGNMEIGRFLYHHPLFSFYTAAGPYFFLGRSKPIWGGEIRIQPQIMDYFSVNLRYNYDSLFRGTFQGEAILSFPLYQTKKKSSDERLKERRIYQRVERREVIPIHRSFHLFKNF